MRKKMSQMSEKISIIIPVYNVKEYLARCIDSVVRQTFKNLEIILVDDGSNDGSEKICDKYAEKDSRIRVFHKKNEGVSIARNFALKRTTGEYIGFIDSDDYIKENMYESMYQTAKEYQADIVQCGHFIVKDEKILEVIHGDGEVQVYDSKAAVTEIMDDEKINSFVWDKLFKRKLFDNYEFAELEYHEDVASTFKIVAKSKKMVCKNEPLYFYVRNCKSISHTLNPFKYYCSYRAFKEREYAIKTYCPLLLTKNTVRKCTMGITALNTMYREKNSEARYGDQIKELQKNMLEDRKIIIRTKNVPINVKIYMLLLPYKQLYKSLCRLNVHNS